MRLRITLALAIMLALSSLAVAQTVNVKDADGRAEDILKQMTLEEKLDYIGGYRDMRIKAIPRLHIPDIIMSDGPMGARCYGEAAAFPGGITMAATWNPEMAMEIGKGMGDECRARGVHILLAPGVNIYRFPMCGRNFEYLGEDPFLGSSIVVPYIQGLQSRGVLATVKHFACNNQEANRCEISSEIDEQTLREIYLPVFKAAIQKANSQCIMTAYNRVNGVYCAQNDILLNKILKDEWGFKGIAMSDWGACHDGLGSALGGLDLEMPSGANMNAQNLLPAIKDGRLSESVVDEHVRRILRTIIAAGFVDRPQHIIKMPVDNPKSAAIALKGAREGIVLLKNANRALPLDRKAIKSILVIGPNANPAVYCAGGSGYVTAFRAVSILDGIKHVAGPDVKVLAPAIENLGFEGPLKMEVFGNENLEGQPVHSNETNLIDYSWTEAPAPELKSKEYFSVRWTGKIRPKESGRYTFFAHADDNIRVFLDDKMILDNWTKGHLMPSEEHVSLDAKEYNLRVEFSQGWGDAYARFHWGHLVDVEKAAKNVDAVVYCGGFNPGSESEGGDRSFELPAFQLQEIQDAAKVNPHVIVVLNAGGGVGWDGWLDKVPAVLHAWYPGQEVGRAVAEILFGDVNPSGKLPATFEKRWEDSPAYKSIQANTNAKTFYNEGIFVGYRGYDKAQTEPQFCFGYGLSYTTFKVDNLDIRPAGDTKTVTVSCDVTNTGSRQGAEVVQLYVGSPKCIIPRPVRELKAFDKVNLQPGETRRIEMNISKDDLQAFDAKSHRWVFIPGEYGIWVGTSSRSLPLHGTVKF